MGRRRNIAERPLFDPHLGLCQWARSPEVAHGVCESAYKAIRNKTGTAIPAMIDTIAAVLLRTVRLYVPGRMDRVAFSQLAGPDGLDAFSTSTVPFEAGIGPADNRKLRVGWMVGPGYGPIDTERFGTSREGLPINVGCRVRTGHSAARRSMSAFHPFADSWDVRSWGS